MNQGVGRVNEFIRAFHKRLIDCRWQDWEDHVQTSDIFSMYRSFNSISHCTKAYITMNMDRHLKCIMTKFRFGLSISLYIIIGIEVMLKRISNVHYAEKLRKMRFTLFSVALCSMTWESSLFPPSSVNILAFLGWVCCWLQPTRKLSEKYQFFCKGFQD